MGRTNYCCIGHGMTIEEARRDALARDREEHGHEQGYSGSMASSTGDEDKAVCLVHPIPAKAAKVERSARRDPLKWETRYTAETCEYENECQVVSEKTMGACIKEARAYSQKHNVRLRLLVEKVPVKGQAEFGRIHPMKAVMGQWQFTGEARE